LSAGAQTQWVRESVRPFVMPPSKELAIAEIHEALEELIETKRFPAKLSLKEFLQIFRESLSAKGKQVGFLVDIDAFNAEDAEKDFFSPEISMRLDPMLPRSMQARSFLRLALAYLHHNAAYHVRRGYIDIVTTTKAALILDHNVGPRTLDGRLDKLLDDLAEETGVSIVVDQRVEKEAQARVKAKFVNPVTLGTALTVLTDMASLKHATVDNVVYVSSPGNIKKFKAGASTNAPEEPGSGAAGSNAQENDKALPQTVREAWDKAGFAPGWMAPYSFVRMF